MMPRMLHMHFDEVAPLFALLCLSFTVLHPALRTLGHNGLMMNIWNSLPKKKIYWALPDHILLGRFICAKLSIQIFSINHGWY